MKKSLNKKRKKHNPIRLICWIIVPSLMITALVLDGLKVYTFNIERLMVIGACILVMLIPFLKEITIHNISIKKEKDNE